MAYSQTSKRLAFLTKSVAIILKILVLLLVPVLAQAKTFYLDGNLSSNCKGNYSITQRNCIGSDGDAYRDLADAEAALQGCDLLYIRPGNYSHSSTNSWYKGALQIKASGKAEHHTIITTLIGEERQAVICAKDGDCRYNPDPHDSTGYPCIPGKSIGGGTCFYPNPAISVSGNYIEMRDGKAYPKKKKKS